MQNLTQTQGKSSYLYIRMVDSMIDSRPFLYQDLAGTVYHVSDAITIVNSWGSNSPIIAFINADKTLAEPQEFLRQPSVRVIVATSPRGTTQSAQAYHRAVVAQGALYNRVCSNSAGSRTALMSLLGYFSIGMIPPMHV